MSTEPTHPLAFLQRVIDHLAAQPPLAEGGHVAYALRDVTVVAYRERNGVQLRVIAAPPILIDVHTGVLAERGTSFWVWVHEARDPESEVLPG